MNNLKYFQQACAEYGIKIKQFTPYQYRFTIEGIPYDFYPVSGKINMVGTRNYFIEPIADFITNKICDNGTP